MVDAVCRHAVQVASEDAPIDDLRGECFAVASPTISLFVLYSSGARLPS